MSTSLTPSQPTAVEAARQQLDELDALLERMLAIPVCPGEDDSLDDLLPSWPAERTGGPVESKQDPVDSDHQPDEIVTAPAAVKSDLETPENQSPAEPLAPGESPLPPDAGQPFALTEPPVPSVDTAASVHFAGSESSRDANAKEDIAIPAADQSPRRRPGWLASETARAILGGAGLLLLAAALAWAILDWLLWNW